VYTFDTREVPAMRMKKTAQLHIRVTPEQLSHLQQVAQSNERGISEQIRDWIRAADLAPDWRERFGAAER
jgi:hypothetical protein